MAICVADCFEWIGFHIVEQLLEAGHTVDGYDTFSTKKKEQLSMFIGRNDLFKHITGPSHRQNTKYDALIKPIPNKERPDIHADWTFTLSMADQSPAKAHCTYIKTPLLFGEWMPMNEKGMYAGKRFIPFQSEEFQSEAVYIQDFTQCLIQWIKSAKLPAYIEVMRFDEKAVREDKVKHAIFMQEPSISINEKLKHVVQHYHKTKKIFEI